MTTDAPSDMHQRRPCECCTEIELCSYRDTTLINGLFDGSGAWLCDECEEEVRRQP